MLGNALVKSVDRSDLDFNVLVEDDATSKGVASFFLATSPTSYFVQVTPKH